MGKINIPGLVPVQPPQNSPKQPGEISESSLMALNKSGGPLRFFEAVVPIEDVTDAILSIQAQLQFATDTGRNPSLIGIEDFNIAAVKLRSVATPAGYIDPGPSLVIQNPRFPDQYGVYSAYPPAGFSQTQFHYSTANALVALAKDPSE